MSKITMDNLSDNLKAYMDSLGLSEEQVLELIKNNISGDLEGLNTTDKSSLVAAINELFQSANNGKELIATAIGEPLVSTDTFSAMSSGINGLTSSFKSALMNNGVSIDSSDKFKQLIEKLALLADSEGKGIQYASGNINSSTKTRNFSDMNNDSVSYYSVTVNDLKFKPTIIILTRLIPSVEEYITLYKDDGVSSDRVYVFSGRHDNISAGAVSDMIKISSCTVNDTGFMLPVEESGTITYHAFGVGEEDTTLEDSLRDILAGKGVEVSAEDDLASLINKVDTTTMKKLPQWMYDNEWMKLPNCPTIEDRPASCNIDGNLFVVTNSNKCYLFDTDNGEWITKSPIGTTYSSFYPVYGLIDRQFHVVAYYDKHKVYDVDLDTWTTKTDLSNNISFGSVANSKFYGFNGGNIGYKFDPITDTWTSIGYVNQAHNVSPNCIGYGNNIYVIGGWDGNRHALYKTRVLDTLTNTWTVKADCPGCTIYSAIDVIDNKIHLIAGQLYNRTDSSYNHYVYDIQKDSWVSKAKYPVSKTQLGGCVINGWFYCGFRSDESYVYIPQFDQ